MNFDFTPDQMTFRDSAALFASERVAPEAARGGPIAGLRDGDLIIFNIPGRTLSVELPEGELHARLEQWQEPAPRFRRGVMAKYARSVSSASLGAVTE